MEFSDKDRKLILKLARELQLVKTDVKSLQKVVKLPKVTLPEEEESTTKTTVRDKVNVVFSSDLNWTDEDKKYALTLLYETIRDMCANTGIIKFDISINLTDEGI